MGLLEPLFGRLVFRAAGRAGSAAETSASLGTEAEPKYGDGILEEKRDGFISLPGSREDTAG